MKKIIALFAALAPALALLAQTEEELKTLADLGEAKLSDSRSSSLIVFGDTQTYTQFAVNQPILDMMAEWTVANRKKLNIKGVLCTGDLVQYNGMVRGNHKATDQTNSQMWRAVRRAFGKFDNLVPCVLATGNHDYGHRWSETDQTYFPQYFDSSSNKLTFESIVETAPNRDNIHTLENAAYTLDLGGEWGTILVIALEFKPRMGILKWAKSVLSREEFANTRAVILTHHFIESNAKLSTRKGYKREGCSPAEIWEHLISKCPNVAMTVSGHVCSDTSFAASSASNTFTNDAGGKVFSMMFNPQRLGGGFTGNGGDGWLRILEFMPDGKTVKASTYSPLFGISPLTKKISWRTAPCDMFEFTLDTPRPFPKEEKAKKEKKN